VLKPVKYIDHDEVVDVTELAIFLGPGFVVTVRHGESDVLGRAVDRSWDGRGPGTRRGHGTVRHRGPARTPASRKSTRWPSDSRATPGPRWCERDRLTAFPERMDHAGRHRSPGVARPSAFPDGPGLVIGRVTGCVTGRVTGRV
jgi:hypothetical protein